MFHPIPTPHPNPPTKTTRETQQFVQLNPDDMAWDIAMLWIMNFGFQILTYINLSLRLRFASGN